VSGAREPDYGIDSPAIVCGQLIAGLLAIALAFLKPRLLGLQIWWVEVAAGISFLQGALGMLHYRKIGKLKLRETLLDTIPWRGNEAVLDVGCGKALLLIGAARRLVTGKAIGVDIWIPHAMTGNVPEAALENAALEGVADRIELKQGDARELPFDANVFDVVLSNFVLHEMNTPADRNKMLREMIRVLRPGGRLALIDFIFTKECVQVLHSADFFDATRFAYRRAALLDRSRLDTGGFPAIYGNRYEGSGHQLSLHWCLWYASG
jgi:arsenite methyltransferase